MPNSRAIAIGINNYEFLRPLRYAKQDAEAIKDFLDESHKFHQVVLFTEDSEQIRSTTSTRPFRSNLLRFLNQLPDQFPMESRDDLWFFFSGHGAHYRNHDYLMPLDGDPDNIADTAISVRSIADSLQRCGAGNIVLILDACRNNGKKDIGLYGKEAELIAHQKGLIIFSSCSPGQYSYEPASLENGIFTKALLDGLGKKGRCATVDQLDQYLMHRVLVLLQEHCAGAKQTPYTVAKPLGKRHFILMPKYVSDINIAILKVDAYRAERADDWTLAENLWLRILEISSGSDTDAIEGIKRTGIHQADADLFSSLLESSIERSLTANKDGKITQSLLNVLSKNTLDSLLSNDPTLFLNFVEKAIEHLSTNEDSHLLTKETLRTVNRAFSGLVLVDPELCEGKSEIVIMGPRCSGKQVYLAALLHFLEESQLELGCTLIEDSHIREKSRNIIENQLRFEPSSAGISREPINVHFEIENLSYRKSIFTPLAQEIIKKEVLVDIKKTQTFAASLFCGEVFEYLGYSEAKKEVYESHVRDALLDCFSGKDMLFVIDSHSVQQDSRNAQCLLQVKNHWEKTLVGINIRIAIVLSKCETSESRDALRSTDTFITSSFPETSKTIESLRQLPNINIECFSCSAFGFLGKNRAKPNVEYKHRNDGVLKDASRWHPVGVFAPIYWLATGCILQTTIGRF